MTDKIEFVYSIHTTEREGYRKGVEDAANVFSEWYGLPRALMLEKIRALLSKGEG